MNEGNNWIPVLIIFGIIAAAVYFIFFASSGETREVNYGNPGDYEVCVANEQNRIMDETNYGPSGPSIEQTQAAFQWAKSLCD